MYIYIYIYIYLYVYICTHICMYIHKYIHAYIHRHYQSVLFKIAKRSDMANKNNLIAKRSIVKQKQGSPITSIAYHFEDTNIVH